MIPITEISLGFGYLGWSPDISRHWASEYPGISSHDHCRHQNPQDFVTLFYGLPKLRMWRVHKNFQKTSVSCSEPIGKRIWKTMAWLEITWGSTSLGVIKKSSGLMIFWWRPQKRSKLRVHDIVSHCLTRLRPWMCWFLVTQTDIITRGGTAKSLES